MHFALWAWSFSAAAAELPAGFVEETLVTNINAATALAVAPDGRVFIAEQTGALRVWKEGGLLPAPALDLSSRIDDFWERGLIGVTLAPDFPHTPHLFVVYVAQSPFPHHVISRFTATGDRVDANSERILLEGDDQRKYGGSQPAGHQGGPIRFGPDGKLYVALGEQTAGKPAQKLEALQGKILRLNPDGTIPEDNPFFTRATGKYRAVWALGLRNPFGLAFEPGTGRLFENDVGQNTWEEINMIERGANYGWPRAEGDSTDTAFRNPIHAYRPVVGRSITGGVFYPERGAAGTPALPFPPPWRGRYFFADFMAHWLKALDPADPGAIRTFAKHFNGPVALEIAPDGSLLLLNRGTIWRDGRKFVPNSGSLVRIRYTGFVPEPVQSAGRLLPRTLTASGLFAKLNPLTLRQDFTAFEINAPPWQPGVHGRRWISLPAGQAIGFSAQGEWEFPAGAVLVQHYELDDGRRARAGAPFETHVLWFTGPRVARAGAYRWAANREEASLVEDAEVVPLPGPQKRHWYSPGTEEHLNLDLVVTGFLVPVNTRQLNRGDQLQRWNERGWFAPRLDAAQLASLPRLAALEDAAAPLELRARSYLDANCAVCHRPGGPSRGAFDARFDAPPAERHLINGGLLAGDLGVAGARVVVPGDPAKSALYLRVKGTDFFRMPPVSVNDEPSPALPVLAAWIKSLKPQPAKP